MQAEKSGRLSKEDRKTHGLIKGAIFKLRAERALVARVAIR
jgi:hypothetical protein